MALKYQNSYEPLPDGVFRGPSEDMPPAYLEEEKGRIRFVIPNLNRETHLEQAGNEVHRGVDRFTCRDYTDPLQKSYPITITAEKTSIILRGLAHIADNNPHDPALTPEWARKNLDRFFGISEDLTERWFLRLCEREIEASEEYN